MDNSFEKLINRVLDNRYKIENVVGIGGMAYVLKAIDLKNENRPVAIKILNEEFNSDESAVKRFINESEAVAMVDSPNIVKIYDVAMSESLKYIVMEFIDGITLKDYIDKVGTLGWKEAVHYVRQILNALSHAHEKGVVHRDIKPQNVMLLRDGKVKVTDFGIAKTPTSESLTMTDKAIGTVNYISPEQASGGNVDEKSDLYSVGVMLYEMLTGTLPFKAESPVAVAMMQVNEKPVQPREINPQIPIGLEQIVLKAMSKKPDERFNCAASMERALEYFVKNPTIVFSGVSSSETVEQAKVSRKRKGNDKSKHRSMFPIILGIACSFFVVCIISLIIVVSNLDDFTSDNDKVEKLVVGEYTLINLENSEMTEETGRVFTKEFKEELEKEGFIIVVKRLDAKDEVVKVEDMYGGIIKRQDPQPGTERIKPATLILYIDKDDSISANVMPSCVGQDIIKVRNDLRVRFKRTIPTENIVIIEEYNDEFPMNTVFACDPIEGTAIDVENLPVFTFYVSKGPQPVEVVMPDVVGLHRSEAAKILEEEHILYTTVRETSDEPVNTVIRTSVGAGDSFMNDTEVIIYISGSIETDDRLKMPECAGMTKEKAKQTILSRFDIKEENIEYVEEYSQTVAKNKVIKTNPASGTLLITGEGAKIQIYVSKGPEPVEVIMPDVVGRSVSEAVKMLEEKNVIYTIAEETSDEPADTVIRTSIEAGSPFMSDTEVVIYVSEKKPEIKMPDCVGDTKETALSKIAESLGVSGSSVNVVEEYSESTSEGKVIRTSPSAGTVIQDVSMQRITVYVSKGPENETLIMPEVLGYSLSEAIDILRDAGIDNSISRKYEESSKEKNTVVRCNFAAGETLTQEDEIILYVSDASLSEDEPKEYEENTETSEDNSENITDDENLEDILDMRDGNN